MLVEFALIHRGGATTSLGPPRAAVVSSAVRDLDPTQHEGLALRGAVDARVWALTRETEWVGSCAVRVRMGGETRWLARAEGVGDVVLDGERRPAMVGVPITWASNALASLGSVLRWPTALPWHDESLLPVERWRGDAYSFERLVRDPERLLPALRHAMEERMAGDASEGFFGAIGELRRVGHDLWSHDVLVDGAIWGRDYMRAAPGQGLRIEASFDPPSLSLSFGAVQAGRSAPEE